MAHQEQNFSLSFPIFESQVSQNSNFLSSFNGTPTSAHGSHSSLAQLHQNNHINQIILGNDQSNNHVERRAPKLKLTITTTLINQVNEMMAHGSTSKGRPVASSDPLKPANFPAQSIQIGLWKRTSKYEADLVVKCYYKKRKLVWEVLEGNLKYKLEFHWSNIMAIKASFGDNHKPSILDIRLEKPPVFFQEVNPQPRRHTSWQPIDDFTGGCASTMRRHTLAFALGILERHYSKILQSDKSLFQLSRRPFPEGARLYFSELKFRNSFTSQINNNPKGMCRQQPMPPPKKCCIQPIMESSEPPCICHGTLNPDYWLSTSSDDDYQQNTTTTFSRRNINNPTNPPIQTNQHFQAMEPRFSQTEPVNSEPQDSALPSQAVGGGRNSRGGVSLDSVPQPNQPSPHVTTAEDTLIYTSSFHQPLPIDFEAGNTNASSVPIEMLNGCALLNSQRDNLANPEGGSTSAENLTAGGETLNAETLDWWMPLIQDDELLTLVVQQTTGSSSSKGGFSDGRPP